MGYSPIIFFFTYCSNCYAACVSYITQTGLKKNLKSSKKLFFGLQCETCENEVHCFLMTWETTVTFKGFTWPFTLSSKIVKGHWLLWNGGFSYWPVKNNYSKIKCNQRIKDKKNPQCLVNPMHPTLYLHHLFLTASVDDSGQVMTRNVFRKCMKVKVILHFSHFIILLFASQVDLISFSCWLTNKKQPDPF